MLLPQFFLDEIGIIYDNDLIATAQCMHFYG
jgi:hypothetical protein